MIMPAFSYGDELSHCVLLPADGLWQGLTFLTFISEESSLAGNLTFEFPLHFGVLAASML